MEKLTEELTVKLSPTAKRFISSRARQMGMESSAEYMRSLVSADLDRAASDFSLLAEALGAKVIKGNGENHG